MKIEAPGGASGSDETHRDGPRSPLGMDDVVSALAIVIASRLGPPIPTKSKAGGIEEPETGIVAAGHNAHPKTPVTNQAAETGVKGGREPPVRPSGAIHPAPGWKSRMRESLAAWSPDIRYGYRGGARFRLS